MPGASAAARVFPGRDRAHAHEVRVPTYLYTTGAAGRHLAKLAHAVGSTRSAIVSPMKPVDRAYELRPSTMAPAAVRGSRGGVAALVAVAAFVRLGGCGKRFWTFSFS